MVQWTWGCRCLFQIVISFPLDKYPEVGLLDDTVVLFLIFWGSFILFSIVAAPIYIPNTMHHGSLFSTIWPILVISCLFKWWPSKCVWSHKTPINQSNSEKKKKHTKLKLLHFQFQTVLQSHSNRNSMVLAQKQACRFYSVEQNGEPRNKPTHIWSIYNKGAKNMQWRKNSFFNKWYRETR